MCYYYAAVSACALVEDLDARICSVGVRYQEQITLTLYSNASWLLGVMAAATPGIVAVAFSWYSGVAMSEI